MRAMCLRDIQNVSGGCTFCYDLKAGFRSKHRGQALAVNRMIVDNRNCRLLTQNFHLRTYDKNTLEKVAFGNARRLGTIRT